MGTVIHLVISKYTLNREEFVVSVILAPVLNIWMRFSALIQTCPGDQPASSTMGTGSLSQG